MIFPTLDDICDINEEWIRRYGGRYIAWDRNLRNRGSLEYILIAIQYPVFDIQRFPRLIDKAAALAWWIINGHIFNDGNKRTGMQSAIEFLGLNGVDTDFDIDSTVEISLAVAIGSISIEQLTDLILQQLKAGDPYQEG